MGKRKSVGQYFNKAIIEPADEGGFFAHVPKHPGCVSQGESYAECLANIQEADKLYLEVARERKNRIIEDDTHVTELCISL